MTTFQEKKNRSEDLLQRFFDRELSDEESFELLSLWREQPDWENEARLNLPIEAMLQFHAKLEQKPIFHHSPGFEPIVLKEHSSLFRDEYLLGIELLEIDEIVRLAAESPSLKKNPAETERQQQKKSVLKPYQPEEKHRLLSWILVPAVLLLLSVVYFEFRPSAPEPSVRRQAFRPFAEVEAMLDVQWNENQTGLKEGCRLEAETFRFQSGIVQIRMKNGVRLAVRGPADFRINTVDKVFCGYGEMSVTVPPEGKGFEVVTPFMNIVDLGTEFFVDVKSEGVEAHTIQGKIELNRFGEEKIELNAGNAFRLDANDISKRFVAEPNRFLTELFVAGLWETRDAEQLERWKAERERILATPGLRLFLDFEDENFSGIRRCRILGARPAEGLSFYTNRSLQVCSFFLSFLLGNFL